MPRKKESNLNFEEKFRELEKITADFESGDLDLEKSLKEYERGMKIAAELKKNLVEMENRVKKLKTK